MTDTPGVGTIMGLAGEPPAEIPIDRNVMASMQRAISAVNPSYIAIIPYCYKCKVPLTWRRDGDELFVCPNCGRVWVKGEGWNEASK